MVEICGVGVGVRLQETLGAAFDGPVHGSELDGFGNVVGGAAGTVGWAGRDGGWGGGAATVAQGWFEMDGLGWHFVRWLGGCDRSGLVESGLDPAQ